MTRGGGKVALEDLDASVFEHFATREDLGKLSQKVDQLATSFATSQDALSKKVDKLTTSFEGYTRREAAISELRACRSFEKFMSDAGKHCAKKDIALLYTPDMKSRLTDFDGLYLANTTPGPATGRPSADAQRDRGANTRPAPSIGPLKTNAVVPSRGGPVVVIEAKHDIDKSKIDFKLRQMAVLMEVAQDASNFSLSSTTRRNPPPPSGGGAKAANSANLDWFAQHAPRGQSRGLVVLFAAENWTPALRQYVTRLNDGTVPTEAEAYDALCAEILEAHDAAFCDALNAEARRLLSLPKTALGSAAKNAIRAVIVPSRPATVRDFDEAAFKQSVAPESAHETRKFLAMVDRMRGFVALPTGPHDDLAAWEGRVGVLHMDGTCTSHPFSAYRAHEATR